MIVIKDSNGNILSTYTQNVSPRIYGGKTIMREYMDGSHHVQTIGEASQGYSFDAIVTRKQAEHINREQAKGAIVILRDSDTGLNAKGYIRSQIKWDLVLRGKRTLYKGHIDFVKRVNA